MVGAHYNNRGGLFFVWLAWRLYNEFQMKPVQDEPEFSSRQFSSVLEAIQFEVVLS
jgi:hypothetical protein